MNDLGNSKEEYLVLFSNIHKVMKAEHVLKSNAITYQVVPVPSAFSNECGMCIRLDSSKVDLALELLHEQNIEFRLVING